MKKALAALLVGLVLAPAVQAAPKKAPAREEPPMRVALVKSAEAGCEPSCAEWIAAQGKIDAAALRQFRKVIEGLGTRRVPILIHSGGGDMDTSFAIGKLLREKGFDIAVARTAFVSCAPKDSACRKSQARGVLRGIPDDTFSICASACAFVLAAGEHRYVGPWAFVGVHQVLLLRTYTKVLQTYRVTMAPSGRGAPVVQKKLVSTKVISQKVVPKKAPQAVYDRVERYFSQMGVDASIMPLLLDTPNENVRWLNPNELRSTHIATHRMTGGQLVAGAAMPGDGWTASRERNEAPAGMPLDLICAQFKQALSCSERPASTSSDLAPPLPVRRGR